MELSRGAAAVRTKSLYVGHPLYQLSYGAPRVPVFIHDKISSAELLNIFGFWFFIIFYFQGVLSAVTVVGRI